MSKRVDRHIPLILLILIAAAALCMAGAQAMGTRTEASADSPLFAQSVLAAEASLKVPRGGYVVTKI